MPETPFKIKAREKGIRNTEDLPVPKRVSVLQSPKARIKTAKVGQQQFDFDKRQKILDPQKPQTTAPPLQRDVFSDFADFQTGITPTIPTAEEGLPEEDTAINRFQEASAGFGFETTDDQGFGFEVTPPPSEFGTKGGMFGERGPIRDTLGDVKEFFTGTFKDLKETGKGIAEDVGKISRGEGGGVSLALSPIKIINDVVANAFVTGLKILAPQDVEDSFKKFIGDASERVLDSEDSPFFNATGMTIRDASAKLAERFNELPEPVKESLSAGADLGEFVLNAFGLRFGKVAGEAIATKTDDLLKKIEAKPPKTRKAAKKIAEEVPKGSRATLADNMSSSLNKINPSKQREFIQITGKEIGQWLNERGFTGTRGKNVENLVKYWKNTKSKVDEAFAIPRDLFKTPEMREALDILEDELGKRAKGRPKTKELSDKFESKGLTLAEENEVKRLFERNVALEYKRDLMKTSKQKRDMTDLDGALRTGIFKRADDLGIENIGFLNKETQAAFKAADAIAGRQAGQASNNLLSLTDNLTLLGATTNPSFLALYGLRKVLTLEQANSLVIKFLNKGDKI